MRKKGIQEMRKGNIWTRIAAFLLVIILLGIIGGAIFVGIKSEGFKNWDYFKGEQTEQPEEEQPSGVTDGEGNELESGTAYAMPTAMVYSIPTAQSSASEGITIKATVLPETAINKNVTWTLSFADDQSEWATGKTVTDYVTVTENETNSREATIVCEKAFAEQILLTAASVADPTKTATCTIDYAQSIVNYTLSFGDVVCNFGGDTDVTMEIDPNATETPGGLPDEEIEKNAVYTIADEYVVTYSLVGHKFMSYNGNYQGVQGWFIFGGNSGAPNYDDEYADFSDYQLSEKGLYFGLKWMNDNMQLRSVDGGMGSLSVNSATTVQPEEFIRRFDNAGQQYKPVDSSITYTYGTDMDLLDLTVTITGKYSEKTYSTTFVIADYSYEEVIQGIELDKSEIVFGKE